MKFGGTSMGSAERMRVAAEIIRNECNKRPVCVVVSAMSKVTDLLLDTLRHAELGDRSNVENNFGVLLEKHVHACEDLLGKPASEARFLQNAQQAVQSLCREFQRIANGILMLGTMPPRSVDEASEKGRALSSALIAEYLDSSGVAAKSVNAADVIVTDAVFGNASPQMNATETRCHDRLKPLLEKRIVPIVTGFNGATPDGQPTTLGRGGSDFSASILAAALDASELWIWTDVDGIMTADPRLVPEARVLSDVTYNEAAELAYNGAKVLHPRTLAPLADKKIPVWSKNSFNLAAPGTKIVPKLSIEPKGARAVTSM